MKVLVVIQSVTMKSVNNMGINPWRVAAYCTSALAFSGTAASIVLDGPTLQWATLFVAAAAWTRIEWVLAAFMESKKDDTYDED